MEVIILALTKNDIKERLLFAAISMSEASDYLSEIDSKFGDGDHGITINKISKAILEKIDAWEEESIKDFFDELGTDIMAVRGGSAGPLYGTLVGGFGQKLREDETELDADAVKRMFLGCLEEMQDITEARVGDKTMMDALIPAVEEANKAEGSVIDILEAAAEAAENGALASKAFVSKYGRAKSYKEQTIGTPDAGAVSTAIFINGLAKRKISW